MERYKKWLRENALLLMRMPVRRQGILIFWLAVAAFPPLVGGIAVFFERMRRFLKLQKEFEKNKKQI